MPRPDRERRDALVACVRDHPPEEAVPALSAYGSAHGLARIGELARRHGVTGCLWTAVRAGGLAAAPGASAVRERHATSVATHLRTLADLDLVDGALRAAGVAYLVIKGPVLAEAVYRRPDLREYVDLDLLVTPADFGRAIAALEAAGCSVYERNWRLVRERMLAELRLFTPAGTIVDLHWHVVNDARIRAGVPADLAGARSRARTVPVGGRPIATLDPADTVVHLGLHASLSGANRLVWLKDLEQALLTPDAPGWDELTDRALRWRAGPALAVVLTRVRDVLGVPVPLDLLRRLVPERRWRAVTRAADLVAPAGQERLDGSVARMVARSSRADAAASRRELGRRVLARARHPVAPSEESFDPADPGSAAFADGGDAERSAYLAEVARLPS
jgi:Uncharacterised nucleotidyltransferase